MKHLSRRNFLATSVAGTTLLLNSPFAFGQVTVTRTPWPSAASEGSVSAQTTELQSLINRGIPVLIRAGAPRAISKLVIANAIAVDIAGETGAVINVMTTLDGAFRVYSAPRAYFSNFSIVWPGTGRASPRNNAAPGIYVAGSPNVVIDNVSVSRPSGAGILLNGCTAPKVTNTKVDNTGADGIHFANCSDVLASNLTTAFTGDDGVAFVDYDDRAAPGGFTLVGAKITESLARGLAIVGASRGTATDIIIDGCASNNIHIEQDPAYKTRFPSDITVRRVTATRSGGTLPKAGNQYGINVLRATKVLLDDIQVSNGTGMGISVVASQNVALSNVRSSGSPVNGMRIINCTTVTLSKVKLQDTVSQIIYIGDSNGVTGDAEVTYVRTTTLPAVQISNSKNIGINALSYVGFPINTLKLASTSNTGTLVIKDTPPAATSLVNGVLAVVTQTYNGVRQATDSLAITFPK
ncbi:right-handed parallel beta-helix repeat-containing protein [Duganella sp. PWIR1]